MNDLATTTALITGGNSGIGLAAARRLAAAGATVIIVGRDQATLDTARRELGAKAHAIRADVARTADLDRMVAAVRAIAPRLDLVFVNAGIAEFRPLEQSDEAFFDRIMGVNLKGAYFTVQKTAPLLADGGSVVLTTSGVNVKGWPGTSVYAASKAALRSLVRVFAVELAPRGIRVNAVSPGPIETPIFGRMGLPQEAAKQMAEGIAAQVPLKRFGTADEVADAVLFLHGNRYITASELAVDGGIAQI